MNSKDERVARPIDTKTANLRSEIPAIHLAREKKTRDSPKASLKANNDENNNISIRTPLATEYPSKETQKTA